MGAFTPPDPNFTPGEWKVVTFPAIQKAALNAINAQAALPFVATREIEIDEVWFRNTTASATAGNISLGWAASGTAIAAGALAAANRISDALSIIFTAATAFKATLTGGSVYSVPAGAQLFAHCTTDQSAGTLADLWITIRYREKALRS